MADMSRIIRALPALGLMHMGALHPETRFGTVLLIGAGPGFWAIQNTAPEGRDGKPDPVDRYSTRVVSQLARDHAATPLFPFGGPPYEPFIAWATATGEAWQSPVGMLVHHRAGLMISYRGALGFADRLPLPPRTSENPCLTCPDQPCATACPVGALSAEAPYDVPACHAFLTTPKGHDCMANGCAARRACPVSDSFGRDPAQSAHHMDYFHPT